MWQLDHKEGWGPKNWCFRIVVMEKTLESPVDCKEIKPVNPKGNQPWLFTGRTDAEAPILWPPDAKSQLIGKDPVLGKTEARRGQQRMRWLDGITDSMDMSLSKIQCAAVHRVANSPIQLSDWTTTKVTCFLYFWDLCAKYKTQHLGPYMALQERTVFFALLFEVQGKTQESRGLGPGHGPCVTSAASPCQFLCVIILHRGNHLRCQQTWLMRVRR